MEIVDRALLFRRAAAYEKQSQFYGARAHEAHHTAVAADYFRREAARLRRLAEDREPMLLLANVSG